jgi:hypothetical protein
MPRKKKTKVKTEPNVPKTKRGKSNTIPSSSTKKSYKIKRKRNKEKKFAWKDPKNYPFYISLFGYFLFTIEIIFYWLLSENVSSFLGLLLKNLIREPYIPTIIGLLFLLPINTYLTGTKSNFRKVSLVGYFLLLRNIAHFLFILLSYS